MPLIGTYPGWWFGTWLLFFHSVGKFIIPFDELIFFRGVGWNHQPDIAEIGAMVTWSSQKTTEFPNTSGWWFGTFFIFPYIWNVIIPIDSYFSEGFVQPPTRIIGWKSAASAKPMVCDPHNLLYGCLIPAERKDGASKVQFLQRHPSVQCWWVQCIKQPNSIQLVSN